MIKENPSNSCLFMIFGTMLMSFCKRRYGRQKINDETFVKVFAIYFS